MLSWLLRVKSSVLSLAKPSFSSPSPSSSCAWKSATHHIPFPHFHYVHVHRKAFHTAYKTFYIDAHTNMIYITILHASYKTFLNHYLCEQNDARHSQLTLSLSFLFPHACEQKTQRPSLYKTFLLHYICERSDARHP